MKHLLIAVALVGTLVTASNAQAQEFQRNGGRDGFEFNQGFGQNSGGRSFGGGFGLLQQANFEFRQAEHDQTIAYRDFNQAQKLRTDAHQDFLAANAAFSDGDYRLARRDLRQANRDENQAQQDQQTARQDLRTANRDITLARFDEREYRYDRNHGINPPGHHHGGSPD